MPEFETPSLRAGVLAGLIGVSSAMAPLVPPPEPEPLAPADEPTKQAGGGEGSVPTGDQQ